MRWELQRVAELVRVCTNAHKGRFPSTTGFPLDAVEAPLVSASASAEPPLGSRGNKYSVAYTSRLCARKSVVVCTYLALLWLARIACICYGRRLAVIAAHCVRDCITVFAWSLWSSLSFDSFKLVRSSHCKRGIQPRDSDLEQERAVL